MTDRDCPCREFLVRHHRSGELRRWMLCPTALADHGYLSTRAADHLEARPVVPSDLNRRLAEIVRTGQVPWVDLDDRGDWQIWIAHHGEIPPEVTR